MLSDVQTKASTFHLILSLNRPMRLRMQRSCMTQLAEVSIQCHDTHAARAAIDMRMRRNVNRNIVHW